MSKQNQIIIAIVAVVLVALITVFGIARANTVHTQTGNADSAAENEMHKAIGPVGAIAAKMKI